VVTCARLTTVVALLDSEGGVGGGGSERWGCDDWLAASGIGEDNEGRMKRSGTTREAKLVVIALISCS